MKMVIVWVFISSALSVTFATFENSSKLTDQIDEKKDASEDYHSTDNYRFKNLTDSIITDGRVILSTSQSWRARQTLISSTWFKNSKCLTVGYNLQPTDLAFFQSLGSQLVYIESGGIPDLGLMMYYSWCVR